MSVPPTPKNVSRSLRWCFTLNNFTDLEESLCRSFAESHTVFLIFGREHVDPGSGSRSPGSDPPTPHLQGYFELKQRARLSELRKFPCFKRAHFEPARGTAEDSISYCTKEDPEAFRYGEPRPSRGDAGGAANAERYAEAISHAREGNLDLIDPRIYLPMYRTLCTIRDEAKWGRAESLISSPDIILRQWQIDLENRLWGRPDDRKLLVFVDPRGGAGKSTFCDWLHCNFSPGKPCGRPRDGQVSPTVQVFHPSRGVDLAYLLQPCSVFVLDCPRAATEYLSWSTIEEIKNGFVTSTKYQCASKRFPRPHVILFMNAPIPDGTFSEDRLEVTWLSRLE